MQRVEGMRKKILTNKAVKSELPDKLEQIESKLRTSLKATLLKDASSDSDEYENKR